jgi:2-desacetyl-2-hydroxyethyl bacteriochlorophyllide A dehydrogenase
MKRASLYFTGPGQIQIREESLAPPPPGKLLIRTLFSAISAGSELLLYRGLCPADLPLDASIPSLEGLCSFPMKYGYSTVGKVTTLGKGVPLEWGDRLVFSFHPHESHFIADVAELLPIPPGISPEEALFLPNLETAINFVMDGKPTIGERLVVFGQGIVGLLTTALLAKYPLARLLTVDRYPLRRKLSLTAGAFATFDPGETGFVNGIMNQLEPEGKEGSDLTFEISGAPEALGQAIDVTGFGGRIVIGSWYGLKPVHLNLGGQFHRSRISLIASQVSSISPEYLGRWTKSRRFGLVWQFLREINPEQYITHRFSFNRAADAFECLDKHSENCAQVLLVY